MVDQKALSAKILELANMMVMIEGGTLPVSEVRIVDAPMFFDNSYGTSMVLDKGSSAIRVSVKRPPAEVADTILHETAHVIMGAEHVENPDHGQKFQALYQKLRVKYFDVVMQELTRP